MASPRAASAQPSIPHDPTPSPPRLFAAIHRKSPRPNRDFFTPAPYRIVFIATFSAKWRHKSFFSSLLQKRPHDSPPRRHAHSKITRQLRPRAPNPKKSPPVSFQTLKIQNFRVPPASKTEFHFKTRDPHHTSLWRFDVRGSRFVRNVHALRRFIRFRRRFHRQRLGKHRFFVFFCAGRSF